MTHVMNSPGVFGSLQPPLILKKKTSTMCFLCGLKGANCGILLSSPSIEIMSGDLEVGSSTNTSEFFSTGELELRSWERCGQFSSNRPRGPCVCYLQGLVLPSLVNQVRV